MPFLQEYLADLILIAALTYYAVDGWRRGFASVLIDAGGFFASIIAATLLYAPLGNLLFTSAHVPSRSFAKALGYVIAWVAMALVYVPLAKILSKRIPKGHGSVRLHKAFGILAGILNGSLFVAFIISFALVLPFAVSVKRNLTGSAIGGFFVNQMEWWQRTTGAALGGAFKETLSFVTVIQDSNESVDLGFATSTFRRDAEAERRLLVLVNTERAKRGLKPLVLDPKINAVARDHGADMLQRGYFSHVTPEGLNPGDRATAGGVSFRSFSENIASAPDLSIAHGGFMNSPAHSANILSSVYKRIGIAVQDAGLYGIMVTQNFAD